MKKLATALIVTAAFGFSTNAIADEYAMAYSSTELTNSAGIKQVHERIVKVAKQYCPTYSQIRNHNEVAACVSDVVEDLVSKVDHPRLTSYHTGDESVQVATADAG
ncbi:MAG: UrcA family protein [Pseudomonadaceae bacterium]|nr:UrcA family protein [Pseudomonadaceae bacterium]